MPGEYDFKGPEHYKALLTHHTDALAKAALATGIAKQDHLQRAKFYAQKLKEHPLHTKKEDVTVNESIVDAVKRGAERVKNAVQHGSAETLKAGFGTPDNFNTPAGIATTLVHTGIHAVDNLSGGRISRTAEVAAAKARDLAKKALKKEDWAVGPQEGPTPVLAIQASRKKSKYKDPEGGMAFGEDAEPLEERRGLMRMALRGVRMARIRAQREAQKAADARREAEAAAGGGDDGGPIDDQPMFRKPGSSARKFKTTNEEKTEKPHPKGTRVVVSHKGHQKVGKVIRHDPGGPDSSPFYIVDVGEYGSHKVMAHNVRKEDLDEGIVKTVARALTGRAEAARRAEKHYDQGDDILGGDEGKKFRRNYKAARNYDRIATGNRSVKFGSKKKSDTNEEKMTAAQKKKREEVAMAIKRDKPGMPMGKKMAIATSVAMKTVKKEGKVSSELPTNPKNLPLLKERDPSTGRLAKSRAARRVEEIVNCGKNKIDTEPVYNQLSPASGGTGYVNT